MVFSSRKFFSSFCHFSLSCRCFSYSDTKDRCTSSQAAASFTMVSLNVCITNDDGTSNVFTGCSNSKISITAFSDSACKVVLGTGEAPLLTCEAYTEGSSTGNNGYHYNSFYSTTCV
jgi:hypothetical protein